MSIEYYLKKHLAFPHRGTGTGNEKKAARMIYDEYLRIGYLSKIHEFQIVRNCLTVYAFEYFLIILAVALFLLGFTWFGILSYIAGILMIYEFPTKRIKTSIVKRISSARSQNVYAYLNSTKKHERTIVLVGHYDTSRYYFGLKFLNKLGKSRILLSIDKFFPNNFRTHFVVVNLCIWLILVLFILSANNFIILVLTIPVLATFLILGISSFLPFVPGAIDNASGSSLVLALAEYFKKNKLENTRLLFLNSGSEENMTKGAVELLLHENLDKDKTYIINFDGLGGDELVALYGESNWYGASRFYNKKLFTYVEKLISEKYKSVRQIYFPLQTDCADIINAGYKVVTTLSSLEEGYFSERFHQLKDSLDKVDVENLGQAKSFAIDLLWRIDSTKTV